MNVEIITTPLQLAISGFSGIAHNQDYTGTAFKLMDKTWQAVKANNIKNKGQNIWVYDNNQSVFAGVELEATPTPNSGLEQKNIILPQYGYYKHIGPYSLIKQMGQKMNEQLKARGFTATMPYIEIYGHWAADESKLVTELITALQ